MRFGAVLRPNDSQLRIFIYELRSFKAANNATPFWDK